MEKTPSRGGTVRGAVIGEAILRPLGMTMSGTTFADAMRTPSRARSRGHRQGGEELGLGRVGGGAGAIRSTANDVLRYLKANMGIDQSPLAAAMKLAQRPRNDMSKTVLIGLAWMTTDKGIVWHYGMTGG
jgi:CubicO group peptidase (beta-lactamase class C family)